LFEDVPVRSARRVALGDSVEVAGAGVLAFDGERERVLSPGQRAILRVSRDGPWVIDVPRVLARAAREGWLMTGDRFSILRASPRPPRAPVAIGAGNSE
jgi:hypothetical protein